MQIIIYIFAAIGALVVFVLLAAFLARFIPLNKILPDEKSLMSPRDYYGKCGPDPDGLRNGTFVHFAAADTCPGNGAGFAPATTPDPSNPETVSTPAKQLGLDNDHEHANLSVSVNIPKPIRLPNFVRLEKRDGKPILTGSTEKTGQPWEPLDPNLYTIKEGPGGETWGEISFELRDDLPWFPNVIEGVH